LSSSPFRESLFFATLPNKTGKSGLIVFAPASSRSPSLSRILFHQISGHSKNLVDVTVPRVLFFIKGGCVSPSFSQIEFLVLGVLTRASPRFPHYHRLSFLYRNCVPGSVFSTPLAFSVIDTSSEICIEYQAPFPPPSRRPAY